VSEVLHRRLGTGDAVVLGLAAMLGAGVFTVFSPAARLAGLWLPLAIVLAGVVAACNAFSTADLAANLPESGGGYVYGRRYLAPWAGRLAGVAFLAGKTASAAAAAGVFGGYVLPGHPLWVAIPVILVVSAMNMAGVRWTARGAWVLVPAVLAVLGVVVVTALCNRHNPADPTAVADPLIGLEAVSTPLQPDPVTPLGFLGAAGLMFFAFAGYARMATLGEEVRDPARTLRRAIPLALAVTLVTYLAVGGALLYSLGAYGLASTTSPLATVVGVAEAPALGVLVRFGAAAASASALLSVLVGVSRTSLAMARRGDLPHWLSAISPRGTPWRADLVGAAAATLVAVLAGPVAAVALSACCVLVYYAVINCAALRLPVAARRWPAWTAVLGLVLCVLLAVLLPHTQVLVSAGVLVTGWLLTTLLGRRAHPVDGAADGEGADGEGAVADPGR
jgi:APA family basic amino acid/polyamine antiporter